MNVFTQPVRILALILLLLPAACNLFEPDCSRPEVFCAGLVTGTGGLQDHGLAQSAWDALQRALDDGRLDHAAAIESVDARDYGKNLSLFARQGYDVILAAGVGLHDDTLQAADRDPDRVFIGLDQPSDESRHNFIAVTFAEDQAGFLAGALAAHMTETGVVGAACETSGIAAHWRACEGFRAGVRHADAQVKVLIAYREDGSSEKLFRDADWGHATALDLIWQGADVIFGVGGGTGQAALIAAAESGAYAIGWERDQFYVTREAQPALLTSLIKNAGPAVYDLVPLIRNRLPLGADYPGQIEIAPYHDQDANVSGQVQQVLIQLKTDLAQEQVLTGVPPEPPK